MKVRIRRNHFPWKVYHHTNDMTGCNPEEFATFEKARNVIDGLDHQFQNGNGKAGYMLSVLHSEGNTLVPQPIRDALGLSDKKAMDYTIKSYHLLRNEAELGDGESMHLLAQYYQTGMPPVSQDRDLFKLWTDRAAEAGYVCLENLLAIYGSRTSEFYDPEKARRLRDLL